MKGETNLSKLIASMTPELNDGAYVFTTVKDVSVIPREITLFEFKEKEGVTVVLERSQADALHLEYHFVAAWITLLIHSSLEAVGLTAAFSNALTEHNISCNVVAGYYHDHIFVGTGDAIKAMSVLTALAESSK
ncbi:ACT domain-containing protein [Mariniflexile sp. AS56]|nr:ACT domain-containing protein [Mariniflexile sp. AS56]MDO7170583.1 ACT domain-containing protein [Mariniflexile sp. AS56]